MSQYENERAARDDLIDRAKCGKITGIEADAEAIRLGLGSLSRTPAPEEFRPEAETLWTIPMAVAWIVYLDLDEVREWSAPYREACSHWIWRQWRIGFDGPLNEGWLLEDRSRPTLALLGMGVTFDRVEGGRELHMTFREAHEALWIALREAFLVASGICARAGGPEIEKKPHGIAKGVHYIRKPGPSSDPIQTSAEWAPLIRRCAMHDRSALLAAIGAVVTAPAGKGTDDDTLLTWHTAADRELLRRLDQLGAVEGADRLRRARKQFSYQLFPIDHPLPADDLKRALHEINNEVHDRVATGWSMFYPFDHPDRLYWAEDPQSGEGDDDFLQLDLASKGGFTGLDFWRLSKTGRATLIREYWEDDEFQQQRGIEPGTMLDPNLLTQNMAEIVRHAQAMSERFPTATQVSFRCEFHGLEGRQAAVLRGIPRSSGDAAMTDHRISRGTWPVTALANEWPSIVEALSSPIARACNAGGWATAASIQAAAPGWVRL